MNNKKKVNSSLLIIGIMFALCMRLECAAPEDDKIAGIPGYPDNFNASVYSGYLKTSSSDRKLHYVFI